MGLHEDLAQLYIMSKAYVLRPSNALTFPSGIADLTRENVLKPLQLPTGVQEKASPFTGRTHGWRLIDFEMAVQTNYAVPVFGQFYDPACGHLFHMVLWSSESDDDDDSADEVDSEEDSP